jgi:hypothetical protein
VDGVVRVAVPGSVWWRSTWISRKVAMQTAESLIQRCFQVRRSAR